MTFTEAAVEVLRRAGKALHFSEIAGLAVQDNLLSHVGQDPEVTMGQRLAAMARREEDRKVVAVAPEGTFALSEWNVSVEMIIEPVAPPLSPPEPDELYRPREREPRAIHAQARKRLQELQAEHEPGSVLTAEAERERLEREEREKQRKAQKGQRRYPPPAEVVFEWLALRQSGAPMKEMCESLLEKSLLSEALVQDQASLVQALLEDNRRRTEAGRKPAFIVDGERVTLVEFPPPPVAGVATDYDRAPQSGLGRPPTSAQLVADTRRAAARAIRRRISELETSAFEGVCAALLEKSGMRDVRVAKRGKEGPLYLARQRRGLSDLRVAVRLVRGTREIGRSDVQELRKDLAHYSAQMGLVLAPGEASREARAEASAAAQPPIALYVGEALAEEMVALRVGVTVQMVELVDVDEAFFLATAKGGRDDKRDDRPRQGREPREVREGGDSRDGREPGEGESAGSQTAGNDSEKTDEHEPIAAQLAEDGTGAAADPAASGVRTSGATEGNDADAADAGRSGSADAAAASPAEAASSEDKGRGRRPPREDRDRPRRAALPSEQAWGQPAGTQRAAGVPYGPVTYDPPPGGFPKPAEAPPAAPVEAQAGSAATEGAPSLPEEPAAAEPAADRPL